MGFPRQEYWSGLPFSSPEDLPNPGIELVSPVAPALADGFFTTEPPGKPILDFRTKLKKGGGHWQVKETVLAILSPSAKRPSSQWPAYSAIVQSFQGSRVNMHSLLQSRINQAKGRKRITSLLHSIHLPLLLSLEMETEPEDLLFIFHIFPWDSALISMDRRFENCDLPALLLALNFMNS